MATIYKTNKELLQEHKENVDHHRDRLEKAKAQNKDKWFHHSDYSEAWERYKAMNNITGGKK